MPVDIDFLRKRKQEIHSSNPCVRETREAKQQTSIFGPENKRTVFFLGFGKKERKSGPINSSCLSKSQNQALTPLFSFSFFLAGFSWEPYSLTPLPRPAFNFHQKKEEGKTSATFLIIPLQFPSKKKKNVRFTPQVRKSRTVHFRQVS